MVKGYEGVSEAVQWRRDGEIVRLTLEGPGGNRLGAALCDGLMAALTRIRADASIRAVVLDGAGGSFSHGIETGTAAQEPDGAPPQTSPTALCDALEWQEVPVIASLDGAVRDDGIALALAAHHRICTAATRFAVTAVRRDLPPGAGVTQRLPRVVGAQPALDLLLDGASIDAARAEAIGLVDQVVPDGADPTDAAMAQARAMTQAGTAPPRSAERQAGQADPAAYGAAIRAARAAARPAHLLAPGRIIDCIEAAQILPFAAGLTFETTAREDCAAGPAAAGLAHMQRAESGAARRAAQTAGTRVERLCIAGGNLAGAGLAAAASEAGQRVTLIDPDSAALARVLERVAVVQERAVQAHRLSAEARDAAWELVSGATDFAALRECDFVIEAADPEAPTPPEELLARVAGAMPARTPLASLTTQAETVEAVAGALERDLVALSMPVPGPTARLVEVAGSEGAAGAASAFLHAAGRLPVQMRGGSIARALGHALDGACDVLLAAGGTPSGIDAALTGYGFARGPYAQRDMLEAVYRRPAAELPPQIATFRAALAEGMRKAGRSGRRAGRGFHDHDAQGQLQEAPEMDQLLVAARRAADLPVEGAPQPDAESVALQVHAALAVAGARLLQDGVAMRASDIDLVAVHGLGFPRWRGGPMHAADRLGLVGLRKRLKGMRAAAPSLWTAPPMLDEMLRNGWRFADLGVA